MPLSSIEICAGAGGQALGLEQAGFEHVSLVEIEPQPVKPCGSIARNGTSRKVTCATTKQTAGAVLLCWLAESHALRFPKRESSLGLTTSGTFSRKPFVWCLNACPRP